MKAFSSALIIFGCFIAVLILSVNFLSEDKSELENISAQHLVYQSIGDLADFSITSKTERSIAETINVLNDNIVNSDIETIISCYTNANTIDYRDYLSALKFSMGQFCQVQQNLEATSTANQNNNDRCTEPTSLIMDQDELKKLDRQYTGDFAIDLASCKIK
jgi:hypothetical protein